jgi:hypothetical protein
MKVYENHLQRKRQNDESAEFFRFKRLTSLCMNAWKRYIEVQLEEKAIEFEHMERKK